MPGDRILSLQALRFGAASGVIILHAAQMRLGRHDVGLVASYGPFGVDLFFVLSGVIIARSAAGMTPGRFILRRLTRVVPFYWLMTLAWMGGLALLGLFSWAPMAPSFLFLPSRTACYLLVAWTLRFEIMFYLATAASMPRPRIGAVMVLAAYGVASLARLRWPEDPTLGLTGSPLALEFIAGMLVARAPGSRSVLACGIPIAIAWLAGIGAYGCTSETDTRVFIYGPPAVFIVYAALHIDARGQLAQWIGRLGDASYAAYLAHVMLIMLLTPLLGFLPPVTAVAAALCVTWIVSMALHEAVEKPLLAACRGRMDAWFLRPAFVT